MCCVERTITHRFMLISDSSFVIPQNPFICPFISIKRWRYCWTEYFSVSFFYLCFVVFVSEHSTTYAMALGSASAGIKKAIKIWMETIRHIQHHTKCNRNWMKSNQYYGNTHPFSKPNEWRTTPNKNTDIIVFIFIFMLWCPMHINISCEPVRSCSRTREPEMCLFTSSANNAMARHCYKE